MNLTDDFLLEHVSQARATRQLGMYAVYLATGNTLFHKTVKSSTVATYLRNIATLVVTVRGLDPRYECPTDRGMAACITKVLNQMKKWEQLPKRREPFTLDMLKELLRLARSENPNSLLAAIANNFSCALYGGYRTGEWAQTDKQRHKIGKHKLNKRGNAYAFTLNDIEFLNENGAPYPMMHIVSHPNIIPHNCVVTFDVQKNDENGEERKFSRNDENPECCFIRNQMQIVQRFVTRCGWNYELPLSVYLPEGATAPKNITSTEIEKIMHMLAKRVYKLNPKIKGHAQKIEKWGGHSLRVGACVYLYTKGFSEMELKFLLRWKSDAFRNYLRNLAYVARKQNKALNEAFKQIDTMPNFL